MQNPLKINNKTSERRKWIRPIIPIANFEHALLNTPAIQSLDRNKQMPAGKFQNT